MCQQCISIYLSTIPLCSLQLFKASALSGYISLARGIKSNLGTILNTGMHNKEGGYENDCSLTRLAYNRFMLMSPSIQQMRSFTWVKHHLPDDGSVYLQVRFTMVCLSNFS